MELTTTTDEGTSSRSCKMVHGITISTIDKKQQWDLPPIYAYNTLPEAIHEVPTRQYIASTPGIAHLSNQFHDKQPWNTIILIGRDCI